MRTMFGISTKNITKITASLTETTSAHTEKGKRMTDNVKHPAHYTAGDIEVIDYIKDKLRAFEGILTPFEGYCLGNVIKYISRFPLKNGAEDLNKAKTYLEWLTEEQNEKETR